MDDELSAHRVRSNVWPADRQQPHIELVAAVEAVYEALEDRY